MGRLPTLPRLNVLGAGRLGRTLARLFHEAGVFEVGALLARTPAHATQAHAFVGAGRAVGDPGELASAEVTLVATPDDVLAAAALELADRGVVRDGDVVFHASGATPAEVLAPLRAHGAAVASVHPVLSFASPERAAAAFAGCWCGVEGDAAALARLRPAFERLGARLFDIDPSAKAVYHAGAVLACNYLPALVESALRAYALAGVERGTALAVLEPIVRGTLDNLFRLGPAPALSGPVARGDAALVARQRDALEARDPQLAVIYTALGRVAVDLAAEQGAAAPEALETLRRLLETGPQRDGG